MASLAAMLAQNPALAEAGRVAVVTPWVNANRILLQRSLARGEVIKTANIETLAQVTASMAAYRALISRDSANDPDASWRIGGTDLDHLSSKHPLSLQLYRSFHVDDFRTCVQGSPATPLPRLLLVEDEPSLCALLDELLRSEYRVEVATDGEQAWESVQRRVPDLVLADVRLRHANLNGVDLTQRLRAAERTAGLLIVLLTSCNKPETLLRGFAAGADDFFAQAISPTGTAGPAAHASSADRGAPGHRGPHMLGRMGMKPVRRSLRVGFHPPDHLL